MSKILTVLIGIFLSSSCWASLNLKCEGWLQNSGEELQRAPMTIVEQTNLNWKQSVKIEEYTYKVNWDVNLDSFYVEIYKSDQRVVFTTARVPTYNHNDSFTDIHLPNGPRLAVSCNF